MYLRTLPRDLFNEANLLKCIGLVACRIEDGMAPPNLTIDFPDPYNGFEIDRDPGSGDIYCVNVRLDRGNNTEPERVRRPLNSRDPWGVYILDDEENEIEIFTPEKEFHEEFLDWATAAKP